MGDEQELPGVAEGSRPVIASMIFRNGFDRSRLKAQTARVMQTRLPISTLWHRNSEAGRKCAAISLGTSAQETPD